MSSSMLLSTSPLNADSQRPSSSTDRVLQPRHDALPPWSRLSLKCGKESVDPDSCHARTLLDKVARTLSLLFPSTLTHHANSTAVRICTSGNVAIYCVPVRLDACAHVFIAALPHVIRRRLTLSPQYTSPAHSVPPRPACTSPNRRCRLLHHASASGWTRHDTKQGTRTRMRYTHLFPFPFPFPLRLPLVLPSHPYLPSVFALYPQFHLKPDSRGARRSQGFRSEASPQSHLGPYPHPASARRERSALRWCSVPPGLRLDESPSLARSVRTDARCLESVAADVQLASKSHAPSLPPSLSSSLSLSIPAPFLSSPLLPFQFQSHFHPPHLRARRSLPITSLFSLLSLARTRTRTR
ncbi:hypothetical protein DFH06DRAFT_1344448 [Mycena polygramma]|nr:hypothetical protein DFH06DRAFT_1344448 [Mycena polygramma]